MINFVNIYLVTYFVKYIKILFKINLAELKTDNYNSDVNNHVVPMFSCIFSEILLN